MLRLYEINIQIVRFPSRFACLIFASNIEGTVLYLDTATALKCHTMATLAQGIVGIEVIAVLTLMFV